MGDLQKTKQISVEKFSTNLNALISSNQLQVTSLPLPSDSGPGRRGSVIANYMAGDTASQNGSEDEMDFECEQFGDDVDMKEEYERTRQLFLLVSL